MKLIRRPFSRHATTTAKAATLQTPAAQVSVTARIACGSTYDWFQKTATFAFDFNYAGGAFMADVTSPAANVLSLYTSGTGFFSEPGRIFFGGDLGTTFKDLP